MLRILPFGGRIKAASVGLNHLYADGIDVDQAITHLRKNPLPEMQTAFFPRVGKDLAQALRGVGFFRPSLKTDQGMPGNFLPFSINPDLETTDLSIRSICHEEGFVISEAWGGHMNGFAAEVQACFRGLDLGATYSKLEGVESRRAEKGRLPFFFIRPALTDRPVVFGQDIVRKVEKAVQETVRALEAEAFEKEFGLDPILGDPRPTNLIYLQPDVFVLADGTVQVEKINCPDVGLFFAGMETGGSLVIGQIRAIVERMREAVADRIVSKMGSRITIVTRDEVLAQQEDVLEIREIDVLRESLGRRGAVVTVIPVSAVETVDCGTRLLLLNLDYRAEGATSLLRRHHADEVNCFPNPYFQMACQRGTGLAETNMGLSHKHRATFLQLASSQPSGPEGARHVRERISGALERDGLTSDIIHVALESETVPVFRSSLHSWRQFAARAGRPENKNGVIRFRGLPATPRNLLLASSTGPRLHGFRFMCVS